MPSLNPVGHQSTNWMVRFVLMIDTAALTSLGTTSPRYSNAQATVLQSEPGGLEDMHTIHTVFALSRVAFDHLVASFEARVGHIRN